MLEGWELLATHEGGTIVALAPLPAGSGSGAALLAATMTGLFRSENAGQHWSPTGEIPLPLLTAVAPSPRFAENGVIYAGTQAGFYRSSDAGRTWRHTLAEGRVFALVTLPGDGPEEHVFVGTEKDGILHSADAGRTWVGANPGLLDLTVLALAFSPDMARDQTGFAATPSGLYRTRNGGKSWRAMDMPRDEPVVQCLAVSPVFTRDRLVLAGTESSGLWRSDDGGGTWAQVRGIPEGPIDAITFSPRYATSRLIAMATAGGVALSRDGGETWVLTGSELGPVLDLAFVPDGDDEALVAGLYRKGAARLAASEHDAAWCPVNAGLTATFLAVLVASPHFSHNRTLIAAGPDAGLIRSHDGGHTWVSAEGALGNVAVHSLAIVTDVGDESIVLAATDAGIIRSRDSGAHWQESTPTGQVPTGIVAAGGTTADGSARVFAVTLGGQMIASDDVGGHWHPLDTPFDGRPVVSLTCSPDYAQGRTLYAGTLRPGPIAGIYEAIVWRSTDGGTTWSRWLEDRTTTETLPMVAQRDGTIFVGLGGRVAQPRRNAWQTRGGTRAPLWSDAPLTSDTGEPVTITALITSPHYHDDGIVFAATSDGVYRSRDRGRTFDRWSDGLGHMPVLALTAATARRETAGGDSAVVFGLGVGGTIVWRASDL